jgi:hypothetical protein
VVGLGPSSNETSADRSGLGKPTFTLGYLATGGRHICIEHSNAREMTDSQALSPKSAETDSITSWLAVYPIA